METLRAGEALVMSIRRADTAEEGYMLGFRKAHTRFESQGHDIEVDSTQESVVHFQNTIHTSQDAAFAAAVEGLKKLGQG
jgi:hypothetical protein